jgi:hypothetical protein
MINFKDYLVGFGFILVVVIFLLQKIRVRREKKQEIQRKKNQRKSRKKSKLKN